MTDVIRVDELPTRRRTGVRRGLLGACLAAATFLSPAIAGAEPVTFARALAMANETGPDLAVARSRVGVARAGLASANKLFRFNPALQGSIETDAPFDNDGDRSLRVGVSQTVELGGQQGLRRDVARAEIAGTTADVRRAQNDLATEVALSFYALDTLIRQLAVEREIAAVYQKLSTSGRTLFERGAITRLELATIEIENARIQAQVERDVGAVSAARHELAGLIGRPGMEIEPVTEDSPRTDVPDVESVIARALAARPELAAARARQSAAAAEGTLAARELWLSPTLSVAVRSERMVYGVDGFRFGPGGVPNLLGVDNRFGIASLDVRLPLPIFEQRNTDRARAAATRNAATVEERAQLTRVEAEARAAVARATAAARALEVQEKARTTMEETATLYESAFARGAIPLSETLLGTERVLRARLNYVALRGEYLRARALVERAAAAWATR